MLGPREVAVELALHLDDHLGAEVDRLAEALGSEVTGSADERFDFDAHPVTIAATQIEAPSASADSWPIVEVVPRRMSSLTRVAVEADGGQTMRAVWVVRVWGWARGDGYHVTAAIRDRLLLAVIETLLRHRRREHPGAQVTLLTERMTAEPSEVGELPDTAATIGGFYVELDVEVVSTVAAPDAPEARTVESVQVDTQAAAPVHPAFLA